MCCREPKVAALPQPQNLGDKLCCDLPMGLSGLHFYLMSFQLRILLFQSLGRHSTACKAISLCPKERNNPCPAPQGQPLVKADPSPASASQRGRGAAFQPPGISLVPGDPSPSPQKGKAVGMELNTPKQARPRAMGSLTPCAPAGSARHTGHPGNVPSCPLH